MDTSVHFTPLKIRKALGALRHLHKHPRLQLCGFAVARRTFIFMWRRGTWCLGSGRGILHPKVHPKDTAHAREIPLCGMGGEFILQVLEGQQYEYTTA